MKKLLTMLFMLAVAFSLTMPVFAQEAPKEETAKAEKKEKKAHHKAKKAKKEKMEKMEKK